MSSFIQNVYDSGIEDGRQAAKKGLVLKELPTAQTHGHSYSLGFVTGYTDPTYRHEPLPHLQFGNLGHEPLSNEAVQALRKDFEDTEFNNHTNDLDNFPFDINNRIYDNELQQPSETARYTKSRGSKKRGGKSKKRGGKSKKRRGKSKSRRRKH